MFKKFFRRREEDTGWKCRSIHGMKTPEVKVLAETDKGMLTLTQMYKGLRVVKTLVKRTKLNNLPYLTLGFTSVLHQKGISSPTKQG